jgi:hypothetical protein
MKIRGIARSILILGIIGTLVSAQQAAAESIFTATGAGGIEKLALRPLDLTNDAQSAAGAWTMDYLSTEDDTLETFDVEVEEEKGPGVIKQLVVFGIITAVVAYSVIVLMGSDDSEPEEKLPGKTVPMLARVGVDVPFTRSP